MTVLAGLLLAGSLTAWRRGRRPRSRLRPRRPDRRRGSPRGRWVVAAPVVLALALALLRAAWPVALAVAAGLVVVARSRVLRRTRIDDADVALPLDLMGGALACGCMPASAAMAAASAAPPAAAVALRAAATRLSLGEDPGAVWAQVAVTVPALAEAARACARAAATGAAVADELHRVAAAARTRAHLDRRRRLQRAAVWLVLPLGLCFLPAFVLVGVVPVVVGAVPSVLR